MDADEAVSFFLASEVKFHGTYVVCRRQTAGRLAWVEVPLNTDGSMLGSEWVKRYLIPGMVALAQEVRSWR